MKKIVYQREKAVEYAVKWALYRNERYYNFDKIGGDCTNFVSQCLYAGCKVMNYNKDLGWYYSSINDRAPAWTGVQYFYNFLINNKGKGPFASLVSKEEIEIGDFIQLGKNNGEFYHAVIVTNIINGRFYVCSHTRDALNVPLSSYYFSQIRYLHILGARK